MQITLKSPYMSIKRLMSVELPDFAVLIGRNGVGKTQLLDAIHKGNVSVPQTSSANIEKYDADTLRPDHSGRAQWSGSIFAERTVEQYFSPSEELAPFEAAREIYHTTLDTFNLAEDTPERNEFDAKIKKWVSLVQDFKVLRALPPGKEPVDKYFKEIVSRVVDPLFTQSVPGRRANRESPTSCEGDSAVLLSLAMKLAGKPPHEVSRDDILRAAHYELKVFGNAISKIFTRYKVEQYAWAHSRGEAGKGDVRELLARYRAENRPPWEVLRDVLDRMRNSVEDVNLFNFQFSDPEKDHLHFADHQQYSFEAEMTNKTTGDSYSVHDLSSGERILMSLCLASFNQEMGGRRPDLLLLDELDSVLHPSMAKALVLTLKERFVEQGTKVILATHSVSTAAVLDDGELLRVSRQGGTVKIKPVLKSEAVIELSDGIATLDTGLKIAMAQAAPITILTEGKNSLHLKKWASLFFPAHVGVFDALPARTSAAELKTYGNLLARMNVNSHFLIVWDCDAKKFSEDLLKELPSNSDVTPFALEPRENSIASKGIENKYDEEILAPYAMETIELVTREVKNRSFAKDRKTEFADFICSNGTQDHFENFDDLHSVVAEIVSRVCKPHGRS